MIYRHESGNALHYLNSVTTRHGCDTSLGHVLWLYLYYPDIICKPVLRTEGSVISISTERHILLHYIMSSRCTLHSEPNTQTEAFTPKSEELTRLGEYTVADRGGYLFRAWALSKFHAGTCKLSINQIYRVRYLIYILRCRKMFV